MDAVEEKKVGVLLLTSGWKPVGWGTSKVLTQLPTLEVGGEGGPESMSLFLGYIVKNFEELPEVLATCDCLHRSTDGMLMPIFENTLHKFESINQTYGGRNPKGWDTDFEGFKAILEDREMDFNAVGPKAVRTGMAPSAFDIDYSKRPLASAWKALYPDHLPPDGLISRLSAPQANAYKLSRKHLRKVGRLRLKNLLDWAKTPGSAEMHLLPFMFNATLRYCALEPDEVEVSEEPEKAPETPPEQENRGSQGEDVDF